MKIIHFLKATHKNRTVTVLASKTSHFSTDHVEKYKTTGSGYDLFSVTLVKYLNDKFPEVAALNLDGNTSSETIAREVSKLGIGILTLASEKDNQFLIVYKADAETLPGYITNLSNDHITTK
jgi:hypothetical protein